MTALLTATGIEKRFGHVRALAGVDVSFSRGEVHALVGENGAGKSTLTRIIGGVLHADAGELRLDGAPVRWPSPAAALAAGIGIIHQEFNLIPELTVAENVFLGRERKRRGQLDSRRAARETAVLLERLGASFSPNAVVSALSVAQQELVEISRVLARRPSLIVMDEPTAPLSADSVERLFSVVRELRDEGVAVVYITHELEHVFSLCDRVTVLRDGARTMTSETGATDAYEVVRAMVGRPLEDLFPTRGATPAGDRAEPLLELADLTLPGRFAGVSLTVRPGEIVGLSGLIGSGRSSLVRTVFGAAPPADGRLSGRIAVDGADVSIRTPRQAVRLGIGLVPEDRKLDGLLLGQPIDENIALPQLSAVAGHGIVRRGLRRRLGEAQVESLGIDTANVRAHGDTLSGGNQQKVVLAKWLALGCRILILDEPTRGVDIGAKVEIYQLIRRAADAGAGVLVVSSSLPEILGLCDRILVMAKGRVVAQHHWSEASEESLLQASFGLASEERALDVG